MPVGATSNREALRYVAEATLGVMPATPVFKPLRHTGENLQFNVSTVTSREVRDDRATADLIPVSANSGGDISFEMQAATYDDFLIAALCGTFGAPTLGVDTIKNGIVERSFAIQKQFQDTTPNVYQNFLGQMVNTMSLDFKNGAIMTGSFGFMGLDVEAGNAAVAGQSVSAATTDTPMNAVTNVTEIEENGVASVISYKSLTLELNNNIRAQAAIGSLTPIGLALGTLSITGSLEAYFSDLVMYNRLKAGTAFAFSFKCLAPDAKYYVFTLPRVKLVSGTVESGGLDTDVMVKGQWQATHDPVTGCMIQVDRLAVAP